MPIPNAAFDAATMVLSNVDSSMSYKLSEDGNWNPISGDSVTLKESDVNVGYGIKVKKTVDAVDSDVQEIHLSRPEKPEVATKNDYCITITNYNEMLGYAYQISSDAGSTWEIATVTPDGIDGKIEGLNAGTYQIRVKGKGLKLTSEVKEVTVTHVHTYATSWSHDETNHWHAATCGHGDERADVAEHTGGTATCTEKAVCSVCKQAYGEVDSENHTGTLSDLQHNDSKHWEEYSCCHVKVEENSHVYDNAQDTACNTCGYVRTITSGGGGIYIPPAEKPATDPTQSGNTTTTDMSGSTVIKGGQTTTTVDKQVAGKLVETAVKNNSEEIVINAVTKNQSAASSTKASEVTLPAETLQTIADKTNADIVIKTDVAEVKLDNKAAEAVASQAQTGTVTVVAEKVKEDAKEVYFELKVVASSGEVISDFNGGNVAVTVNVPNSLRGKKMVCVYIDGNGNWHKVPGQLNANGTYTFTTGHFSTYAIMSEEEADAVIAKQQAEIERIIKGVEATTLKATSSKTAKGIKITWTKSKGYKVDYYVIYRSTKKNSGYGTKPFYTTKSSTAGYYVNSKDLKKGTKYYYKVRGVRVIDGRSITPSIQLRQAEHGNMNR